MTKRLYYTDSYQTDFDATVVAVTTLSDRLAVVLDQTYFYPTSGGQSYDTGVLGGCRVVDVVAGEHNGQAAILHLLDQEPDSPTVPTPGKSVHGAIDWTRRYDHMQQHSGQHLISQLFYRLFGYETVSVHFGAAESTLDLDVASLDDALLDEAEQAANDLVYASLPIRAYFVSEQELERVPLRRPPKVQGEIRIVEIDAYDYSACGGTHCRHTGEIGLIKFTRQERRRGKSRITFLCGKRSQQDYRTKHQLIAQVADLYSTEMGQVPGLVERDIAQIKELQRELSAAREEHLTFQAAEMLQKAERVGPYRLVVHEFDGLPVDVVKTLANLLVAQEQTVALLATTNDDRATVIFARGDGVSVHAGNLLRATLAEFGGGSGGRPEFAQGGGVSPDRLTELLAYAQARVRDEVGQDN